MSPAQQRALDELLPRFGVRRTRRRSLDLDRVFGRRAPRVLEIGCGMGETTAAIAAARPDDDFLGIEVHAPGVGSLLQADRRAGLTNVRVIRHDAVEVVAHMIAPASLAGIHVFFPGSLAEEAASQAAPAAARLRPRARASGWHPAATCTWPPTGRSTRSEMLATLAAEPLLANTAAGFAPRPAYRPLTKFEARGMKLGHGVWDLVFRRDG